MIQFSYMDDVSGQLHVRQLRSGGDGPPLLCLHPAPHSGMYFEPIMPLLCSPSVICAPDYPGYGGSAPPIETPDIGYYAESMNAIVRGLGDSPIDLLGFHTGCLVAIEMALRKPDAIGRLVLIDIPYFVGGEREILAEAARPNDFGTGLEQLRGVCNRAVTGRSSHTEIQRALELFAEQLRPGNRAYLAFAATYAYSATAALHAVIHPGLIIATGGKLLDNTRAAARLLTTMQLIECPKINGSVFEDGAPLIAETVNRYLSKQP